MKKELFKKEIKKLQSLNCRIGRYFTLPDWKGYGKNDSAKVKNVFPVDGTWEGRVHSELSLFNPAQGGLNGPAF